MVVNRITTMGGRAGGGARSGGGGSRGLTTYDQKNLASMTWDSKSGAEYMKQQIIKNNKSNASRIKEVKVSRLKGGIYHVDWTYKTGETGSWGGKMTAKQAQQFAKAMKISGSSHKAIHSVDYD